MVSTINNGDFSVEMWAKVDVSQDGPLLFAIGAYSPSAPSPVSNACPGYDIAITQSLRNLFCWTRVSNDGCVSISRQLPIGSDAWPVHIMCARDSTSDTLYIYLNGVANLNIATSGDYSGWNTSSKVHIGRQTTTTSFSGEIYLVAMYNKFFTVTDARVNYNAYLPNSAPYTTAYNTAPGTVQYISIGEGLIGNITLIAYDYDVQMNASWTPSLKPTSLQPSSLLYRVISPMITKGNISSSNAPLFDSSRILSSSLPYTVIRNDGLVFYRGEQYQYGSIYTTLYFDANDGITTSASRAVPINIYSINDPPVCMC
jgi:hypothetical protein